MHWGLWLLAKLLLLLLLLFLLWLFLPWLLPFLLSLLFSPPPSSRLSPAPPAPPALLTDHPMAMNSQILRSSHLIE